MEDNTLSQEIDKKPPQETTSNVCQTQPTTNKELEKLNVLEKLVHEKMRTLQQQREITQHHPESRSVEHDIRMLEKLQHRIDATKRSRFSDLFSTDEQSR